MTISARLLASELEQLGVSPAQAARDTHYSPSAWSNYLNGKRGVPNELIKTIADIYNSARLKVVHTWECGCGLFKTKYLAGVDDHPVTVKNVGINELREAIEAFQGLPVENKMRREDFTAEEWVAYEKGQEQLCDIHALIEKSLESGQKYFGLDIKAMQGRVNAKLDARGYTKERPLQKAAR